MTKIKPKPYAAIRQWKDNPHNAQVMEYCHTQEECLKYIAAQPRQTAAYTWAVAKWE